jgi:hypothetical protein
VIKLALVGDSEVIAKLDRMPQRLREELKTGLGRLALKMARLARAKVNGPLLRRRTGALWQSINGTVLDEGDKIAGVTSVAGDALSKGHKVIDYARAHEYGFHGTVTVKEHLREIKQAFGRSIAPKQITVRAHEMKMNIPEKAFLRSSLADMQAAGEITAEVDAAISRSMS